MPQVRLITYNVKMLPFGVGKIGKSSHLVRAKRIVRALAERITPVTVVCLQEAFSVAPRKRLEKGLRHFGLQTIGDPPALSGLLVATNLPATGLNFKPFTAQGGVDGLARKGVTGAVLTVPGLVGKILLFTTHLQAGGANDDIRKRQLEQIRLKVLAHVHEYGALPIRVVLCGDLNVVGERPHPTPTPSYTYMCQQLGVARDCYRAQHPGAPGYTFPRPVRRNDAGHLVDTSERLDYILDLSDLPFAAPAHVAPLAASNCDILRLHTRFSDHHPLIADLTL